MIAPILLALAQSDAAPTRTQSYLAWLVTPGGHLQFGLDLVERGPGTWQAFLVNGEERIDVPRVVREGDQLRLEMPHYDSRIVATVSKPKGEELTGTWEKRRGADSTAHLDFHAQSLPASWNWEDPPEHLRGPDVTGRWAVTFEGGEPSIAVLEQRGSRLVGTFLTPTGDFRYLAGGVKSIPVGKY